MKQRFIGIEDTRRVRAMLGTLAIAALLGWTSCSAGTGSSLPVRAGALVRTHSASSSTDHTVVLVALDGVRWRDVFHGVERELAFRNGMGASELLRPRELAPNLHALADEGAAIGAWGPGIAASGPVFLSVPGYMEMMTGMRETGCFTNGCDQVRVRTIADDFADEPGVRPEDVAVIASWEGIERAASRDASRITISVGRTRGETRSLLRYDPVARALLDAGERAGPAPGHGDFRRDQETAAIALHYLRTHRPRFLFVGLGETDEYAHDDDYRGYLRALSRSDNVIGHISAELARYRAEGRKTTLFVTTDHGRAHDFHHHGADAPESAGVWLVAAGWGIKRQGAVTPPETRYLGDVASTIRALTGLPQRTTSSEPLAELLHPTGETVALTH